MPILLLAQGDPEAKEMLRNAIEARYGMRPPALDSLRIDFKGRARVKIGPVKTWVPADVTAFFRFPIAMRWDFTVRPLKMPVQSGIESFDGTTYRSARGSKTPTIITDEDLIRSMRSRLWAVASILLTPLSDQFVKLTAISSDSFRAENTQLNDSASIHLRPDNKLDKVQVECVNPDTQKRQRYTICPSEELEAFNDLILPRRITMCWDDEPTFELEPVAADTNPHIQNGFFALH